MTIPAMAQEARLSPALRVFSAASLALAATLLLPAAASAGPLARFAGDWAGQGTIETITGLEHARCTAHYRIDGSAAALDLACTTESYALDLTSVVRERSGTVAGTWAERRFGTAGAVTGRIAGSRLALAAVVAGARVSITITAAPGRQTVSLRTTSLLVPAGELTLSRSR